MGKCWVRFIQRVLLWRGLHRMWGVVCVYGPRRCRRAPGRARGRSKCQRFLLLWILNRPVRGGRRRVTFTA